MSVRRYVRSPLVRVGRLRPDDAAVIWAGSGFDRQTVEVSGATARAAVAWVLSLPDAPALEADVVESLQGRLGTDRFDAGRLLREMVEAGVLVEPEAAESSRARAEEWSRYGWDDAAAFHSATFGQRFDPDETSAFSREFDRLWRHHLGPPPAGNRNVIEGEIVPAFFGDQRTLRLSFPNPLRCTEEALIGLFFSSSNAPSHVDRRRSPLKTEVTALHRAHNESGIVTVPYETVVYCSRLG